MRILLIAILMLGLTGAARASDAMPPVIGPEEPRVAPIKGEDGIYHQEWFVHSFLDLREDHAEAKAAGKRFAVVFEQRGCIYCTKMHTDVLALKYINDYVRENFDVVQLDLWGSRDVTDFDGTRLPEKKLAERWGVLFTPTVVFFKDGLSTDRSKWGPELEVARMHLGIGAGTFYDMFVWVRTKTYEKDRNFQRFHIERQQQR
ncbi:MAG: thioredoxin family protein [Hyphomicrobiaceae bacterium]|nr:thioredoxin family protein [Hyphomicrobiaceae bacterium]